MLEQQNRPFFHWLVCKCEMAAFPEGLCFGWLTFPPPPHGKHTVPSSPSICRAREVFTADEGYTECLV